MDTTLVLATILLAGVAVISFFLAARFRVSNPAASSGAIHPGVAERLLYPWRYFAPPTRVCPVCGHANPPTAVYCSNTMHPPDQSNQLAVRGTSGAWLLKERTRVWGARVLIAFIMLAALWVGQPLAIYAVLVVSSLWIAAPAMTCARAGLRAFVLIVALVATAVGLACFASSPNVSSWLTSRVVSGPAALQIGSLNIALGGGTVSQAALLITGICLVAVLIGVLLSFTSQLNHRAPDFDGPVTVAIVGVVLSACFLYVVSGWQGISALAQMCRLLIVVSCGWLALAFVERAIVRALPRVKKRTAGNILPTIPGLPRLKTPPRPFIPPRVMSRGVNALFDQLARNVEVIGIQTVYAVQVTVVGLTNVAAGLVNFTVKAIWTLLDLLLQIVRWIVEFLRAAAIVFVKDLIYSFPALARLATLGFRVSLYGPALVLVGCVLVAASADAGSLYLSQGHLPLILLACVAWVGAVVCFALGAALYVDRSLLPAFFDLHNEYISQGILLFPVLLDIYGVERRVLGQPSHFGLVSWLLNIFLLGTVLVQLLRRLIQRGTPVVSTPGKASRLLYAVMAVVLIVVAVYGLLGSSTLLPPTFPASSQEAILFSLHGTPSPTSTTVPPGSRLYLANWSLSLDGWRGSSQWSASGGNLQSTGKARCCAAPSAYMILAPLDLSNTPNYAAQARVKVTKSSDTKNGCYFGVLAHATVLGAGYAGGIKGGDSSHQHPAAYVQRLQAAQGQSPYLSQSPYQLDSTWHTYQIQVLGHTISLFIDGRRLVQVTDGTYTFGGRVGLIDYACQLTVSSFSVSSL
ncbi:MAG TPA: hypothetical protein VFU88_15600 [Ktedonobacterales bacterium]|nr:hypothetical protein [Ktedonobacterales bacterium]